VERAFVVDQRRMLAGTGAQAPAEGAARVTVKLRPITGREHNILIALSLILLAGVAYLAGRLAFPELWPWF
jgi:type II secretory pathway component PulM